MTMAEPYDEHHEALEDHVEIGDADVLGDLLAAGKLDGVPFGGDEDVHLACGHAHRLNDDCVIPDDSPRGILNRVLYSTSTNQERALDRLAAVQQLQALLAEQQSEAVLGARMAGCSWIQMGEAVGFTRMWAKGRWGDMVRRFEQTGLLQPEQLPPPAEPVYPALAAAHPAEAWCRWCGHRLVVNATGSRWAHHSVDHYAGVGYIAVDCPGPEPWPANED